jgi:Rha family phage regulatory protein
MSSISTSATQSLVSVSNNHAITTSTSVAAQFNKRHDNVMREIRKLIPQLSQEQRLNFEELSRQVKTANGGVNNYTEYNLTRDGFALLAMGFTGKNALQFKLKYLAAFNAMETELVRIASESNVTNIRAIASGLSPADQRTLQEVVNRKAMAVQEKDRPARFKKIWGGIKTEFRVGSYKDLDASQLRSAIEYIDSYAWQLLDAPTPIEKPVALLDVSATTTGLLKKLGDKRWILFGDVERLQIEEMAVDAVCIPMRELPEFLRESAWPSKILADIIKACTECLVDNQLDLAKI